MTDGHILLYMARYVRITLYIIYQNVRVHDNIYDLRDRFIQENHRL